jgi:hypothetical protein
LLATACRISRSVLGSFSADRPCPSTSARCSPSWGSAHAGSWLPRSRTPSPSWSRPSVAANASPRRAVAGVLADVTRGFHEEHKLVPRVRGVLHAGPGIRLPRPALLEARACLVGTQQTR